MRGEYKPFIEYVTTEKLLAIDVEARETHNQEALALVGGELARRAMASEVAYDASNDGTPVTEDHIDQTWL